MPDPFFRCGRVFNVQRVGKRGFAVAFGEVFLVEGFHVLQDLFEFGDQALGQDGEAVVVPFSAADDDLAVFKVEVFDAQAEAFHDAESRSVHDFCHGTGSPPHVGDDAHGFEVGQDGGKFLGAGGVGEVGRKLNVFLKDGAVEEEDGAEGLVGGGDGYFTFVGEVGDEGADFGFAHVFGVAFAVKEDVAFDPVFVGLFGAVGVVFGTEGVAHPFHQFFILWRRGSFGGVGFGWIHCDFSTGCAKICLRSGYFNLLLPKIPN